MEKWTSRKLTVALIVFVVATGLLLLGHIEMSEWQWVTSISVGAYLGSQGITDALAALKK